MSDVDETMMTIHFSADMRPVVKERVGMLHWITDPACSGFIIAYDVSGTQVLISNFDVRGSKCANVTLLIVHRPINTQSTRGPKSSVEKSYRQPSVLTFLSKF